MVKECATRNSAPNMIHVYIQLPNEIRTYQNIQDVYQSKLKKEISLEKPTSCPVKSTC